MKQQGHIRLRGSVWYAVISMRDPATGKRKRKWHALPDCKNKTEATKACTKLVTQVDAGTYQEPSKVTIEQHVNSRIDLWESAGTISAKTAERYRQLAKYQINPFIGAKLLQKLRSTDIEAWHAALRVKGREDGQGGVSNRTIGHAHRVLSKALKEAARHELVVKNVAADEGAPTVGDEEMIILSPEQMASLPEKLAGRPLYERALTLVFTGVRRGELLAIRWKRLNLDAKTVTIEETLEETKAHGIRAKLPKTRASRRTVVLPDIVVDALRAYRRQQQELRIALGAGRLPEDDLVFGRLDGQLPSPDNLSKEWRDFADAHGMAGVPLHSLRHTHVSQLIDAGVDIVTISKRIGHASPAITLKIYAHLFRKDDGKAAAAINAALASKVTA